MSVREAARTSEQVDEQRVGPGRFVEQANEFVPRLFVEHEFSLVGENFLGMGDRCGREELTHRLPGLFGSAADQFVVSRSESQVQSSDLG